MTVVLPDFLSPITAITGILNIPTSFVFHVKRFPLSTFIHAGATFKYIEVSALSLYARARALTRGAVMLLFQVCKRMLLQKSEFPELVLDAG